MRDHGRACLTQHRAEVGLRRLRAEAEEAEAGGLQDHPSHGGRHGDDDDRQDVGQKLGQDDPGVPHARKPRGVDEFAAREANGDAANIPGKEGHVDGGHGDERIHQTGPKGRDNGQRQQNIRKGHQHIDAAHDDVVCASAEVPRDDPDCRTDGGGDQSGCDAHGQRQARAVQEAAEKVTAKVVGA